VQALKLPELGENVEMVEVSAILVAVGDRVARDQPVVEVETEKASLEVPATSGGTVVELLVKVGDQVVVGQTLLEIDPADGDATEAVVPETTAATSPSDPPAVTAAETVTPETQANAPRTAEAARLEPAPDTAVDTTTDRSVIEFPATNTGERPEIGATVPAAPSVRALARELGLSIADVPGSGPAGRISRNDVKAFAKSVIQRTATAGAAPPPLPELPDFSQWGEVEREPLSNVRRATVKAMATSWTTVPHVTQFDRADVTQLESMRKRFNRRPDAKDRKLTMTAIVIKMVASVLRQFPKFNASLDLAGDSIVYKKYVHIGVAVDTDRGLLVPVIRDVDRKGLAPVAQELNDLAARARAKKLGLDEMRGAGFTVSNLGGLGTTYFSPIVNWPEVAILGVGRAEHQALFDDGKLEPRLLMPLSISYDHRLIDGADAARFLRALADALEQPLLLLLDE
jgi:pyruvate dehydrogenase E2 component (dihydrolipoamide acetyltransferase)